MKAGRAGTVYLVGAGPGDPGLLTQRGLELLRSADAVLYDRLVDQRILSFASDRAEVIFVGKRPHGESGAQEGIAAEMVRRARLGQTVVRLKGGDPFVFGRGGEEAQALARADIPFEVVPGITSAIAVPAYAGIPVTHREVASSFTVVSGSEDPGKEESLVDWKALAAGGGTLVLLMGWESLGGICKTLKENGMPADTPAALIQWGTRPGQRVVEGTLDTVLDLGKEAGLEPPIVAVFGPAVALRSEIRWFDNRPLSGKRIMVTRARTQISATADLLSREGAEVIELPSIRIVPPDDATPVKRAAQSLASYSWVVFTSVNGVDAFWEAIREVGLDSRAFAGVKVAAIGPATAESLARHGIHADRMPSEYISESVVESLQEHIEPGDRVLLPRAAEGRNALVEGLQKLGAEVEHVVTYKTLASEESKHEALALLKQGEIDAVTFTSSSTVSSLVSILDGDIALLQKPAIACIGPVTATTAAGLGLKVAVQAREYTIAGLVEALKEHFSSRVQSG